jgi:hypothetical protein
MRAQWQQCSVGSPAAFVHEVRDGRIVRDRAYMSRSQALEAAGAAGVGDFRRTVAASGLVERAPRSL